MPNVTADEPRGDRRHAVEQAGVLPDKQIFVKGGHPLPGDLAPQQAAQAIPNLAPGFFTSLRVLHNDLAHNMAADEIRARVFVGIGGPAVRECELQYAQYLNRDTNPDGSPVSHQWARRFYQQQCDAQAALHAWLENVVECVVDTMRWLEHRVRLQAESADDLA